jgi:hypothetical protein
MIIDKNAETKTNNKKESEQDLEDKEERRNKMKL